MSFDLDIDHNFGGRLVSPQSVLTLLLTLAVVYMVVGTSLFQKYRFLAIDKVAARVIQK